MKTRMMIGSGGSVMGVKGGSCVTGDKNPQPPRACAGGSSRLSGAVGAGQEVEESSPASRLPDL